MRSSDFSLGKFVRYGPNRISINSATGLKTIYSSKSNSNKSSLFAVFPKFFNSWSTQTIIDTKKYHHAQKRRFLSQALHESDSIKQSVARNIEVFRSIISTSGNDKWSQPFDISELTSFLSFDIMGDVCFGRSSDMMQNSDNRFILGVISDGAQCLNTVSPVLPGQLVSGD